MYPVTTKLNRHLKVKSSSRPTFIYRHLQEKQNSCGLQFKVSNISSIQRSAIRGRPWSAHKAYERTLDLQSAARQTRH